MPHPGPAGGLLAAVAAVAVAFGFRLALTPVIGPTAAPLQLFYLAVFVAATVGGLWPGLLATGLSVAASFDWFIRPGLSDANQPGTLLTTSIFVAIGAIISALSEARWRALERERRHSEELQREQDRRAAADAGAAAQRERLQLVADAIPVLLVNCDRERRFKFVSTPYATRLGLRPEQLIGRTLEEVLGPPAAAVIAPYVERVLDGESLEFEISVPYPNIGATLMRTYYVPERDADGRVVGWFAALEDVTHVRTTESELKNFSLLVENATDFIGICDLDFHPVYINAAGCRLAGLASVADVQDRLILDFFFPEDLPFLRGEFFPEIQENGRAQAEIRFRHFVTGEPLWMMYKVVLLRAADGAPVGYATISTDLTERKRSEDLIGAANERLRAALDASETGTFRWDIQANAVELDETLERLLGYPAGSGAHTLEDVALRIHPDDRERFIAATDRSAREGADFEQEFRVVDPADGRTLRWLYDKGRTYRDSDGRPAYMAGACLDITERRRKEDALREADRQKDEFLGMLAHELRNPLAPITYSLALLERQPSAAESRRPLEIISRQVHRMRRIVDDLLDVSRVTQGKISLQRERTDLTGVVRQAAEAVRAVMDSRHHVLTVDVPAGQIEVIGDSARLGQVFENLLRNAAKYTPAGGAIRVGLGCEQGEAVVTVADTGIGIAPSALPRVFDLFMQADTSLDRAEGGLGIGLTLVDRLTRLHGGTVEARSEGAGRGSEFIVRLPLAAGAPGNGEARAVEAPGVFRPRRHLIVDDNVDSAEALRALLELRGHTVHVEHDGPAGLRAAREFEPDVVLLDVGLPGLDGFETVRQLRRSPDTAGLLVIATTGYGREEDRSRCLASGFDHHLAKPIDVDAVESLAARLDRSPRPDQVG